MVIIGIDIGHSKACAAFYNKGRVEIIPNEYGNKSIPSYVAFTTAGRLIGESAKNQAASNIGNTVFGFKSFMGHTYEYLYKIIDQQNFPYALTEDNGKPKVVVHYKGEPKHFTFEEITAMILSKVKHLAESLLGVQIDGAVLTVPPYFNSCQRQATMDAGRIAGLNVVRILSECTAAALAYGVAKSIMNKNVLIFDLGGSSLEVSILRVGESNYEVKCTTGIRNLGGDNFDNRLIDYFIDDVRKRFNVDMSGELRTWMRLKIAAERTKKLLTASTMALVHVESICRNFDYTVNITREFFENLCSDLFLTSLKAVVDSLRLAGLEENDIDEVVLIGGSTRMPKIQTTLRNFFSKPVTDSINADHAVAYGAAVQAAVLSGNQIFTHNFVLIDVLPISLGIDSLEGIMCKVVEKNTQIPCRITRELTALGDFRNAIDIHVYEGESYLTKDNRLLGVFELDNISPGPRGALKIDLTFDIDSNGIVTVTASDRITGRSQGMSLKNDKRLNQQDMERMIVDSERYTEEDKERRRCIEAKNQLETYICDMKQMVLDNQHKLTAQERDATLKECTAELLWLDLGLGSACEDFQLKLTELMRKWSLVNMKVNERSILFRAIRQNTEERNLESSES